MRNHRSLLLAAALSGVIMLASQASQAFVSVGISVNLAPPALPVYVQPEIPASGYIWSPGYWAYEGDSGYYWVPGTWVEPPQPGYLWTPGYWGWNDDAYLWHGGYWGTHVGFYGGVNYGFGYGGSGFQGGYWNNGAFFYNRSVNNIPASIHVANVYNKTVINNVTVDNHVSFNGGSGGIQARPTPAEQSAEHEPHLRPVSAQIQHQQGAHDNPVLRASVNHGRPAIAATARPGEFSGHGVIAAHGAGIANHAAGGPAHSGEATTHPTSFNRPAAAAVTGEHVNAPFNNAHVKPPVSGPPTHEDVVNHGGNAPNVPHPATASARPLMHPATPPGAHGPGGGEPHHPGGGAPGHEQHEQH